MSRTHKHDYPLSKKIAAKILPFFIKNIMHLIFLTCKKIYILPKEPAPCPAIWVAWHGQIAMMGYAYRKARPKSAKIHVIVSEHLHGDFAIRLFTRFNMDFIRGSSRKGAIKALRSAIEKLEQNEDVGITPDGPKGPLHSVSDGVITLALKCNVPIVTLGWKASRYWQIKSWDEARMPKPFSTITYKVNEPIYLDANIDRQRAKDIVKNALMSCMS